MWNYLEISTCHYMWDHGHLFSAWNQARSRESSDVFSEQPGRGDERSPCPKLGLGGQISGTGLAWFVEPWPEYHNLESSGIVLEIVGIGHDELLWVYEGTSNNSDESKQNYFFKSSPSASTTFLCPPRGPETEESNVSTSPSHPPPISPHPERALALLTIPRQT